MSVTRTHTAEATTGPRPGTGTGPGAARTIRAGAVALLSAACTTLLAAGAPASATAARTAVAGVPLPYRMADTGGGDQLITARAPGTGATTGTVSWWQRHHGHWRRAGSAPARFGSGGLAEGRTRVQGTSTTPTGLYGLPFGFGTGPAPAGTVLPYRRIGADSWWCQDNASASYNRWVRPLPPDCAARESERLADYPTQYARALVIAFNYRHPVRGRGAGIFLHVNGKGATAGCVSVPAGAMARILAWVRPAARPHIAIGTADGPTALTRY
ncbi:MULTISPECIES: L,D-transpeptidase family protein [Streptomyces]|uniref:L,D-transpeptidase family protein n=1 Tax=Streptomyces TaxID=1883 RepID=UPI000ADD12EC|nr:MULTISPECIES: L,D-transpeptidase family protein [Streptomyces]